MGIVNQDFSGRQRRFGNFTLDFERGFLYHGLDEVKLRPKSFEVLAYLVQHSGRLITKNELIDAVWPDACITDNSLAQCLLEVRRAIADDSQRFIRTVARRGYIFNVPKAVTPAVDDAGANLLEPGVGLDESAAYFRETQALAEPDHVISSVAVLPFVNASSDPQMGYLSDGITESIILSLSQLPQLRVMSRSAVFRYKDRCEEAQVVGQALGVGAVLTGNVLQRGEALFVNAELVDVRHGWQLWGAQYRKKVEDIFAMQENIAEEISERLRLKLAPEKQNLLARRYTHNVEAYHLYLKGRFYWAKRTEEGLHKGIQHFRQAIELDPTYALAYAGLAECYVPLAIYCHLAPKDACPKARAAAHTALEINPDLVEARTVLGYILTYYDWDFEKGEQELRQAIALDPKYARARQALAENLTITCHFEEASIEANHALELDPLALNLNGFRAITHYFRREYDKAIEQGLRTVDMDPSFFPGYFDLGLAYQLNGQFAEAAEALKKARVLSNDSTLIVASLGGAFAAWGKHDDARNILQELEHLGRRKYVSQVFVAAILTALGEIDRALTCLEMAYQDRCTWLPLCLAADGRLDTLRSKPALQRLIRMIGASNREDDQK